MAKVTIANLYHILSYAWNRLDIDWWNDVDPASIPNSQNLFARLLISGAAWTIRKGLERGYIPREDDLAGIRGRLDFANSVQRMLLQRGRAHCQFDELEPDLLENRILKATLARLAQDTSIEKPYRDELRKLSLSMPGVGEIRLHSGLFRDVVYHGRNRHYEPLLQLCELIHQDLLVDPSSGDRKVRSFTGDESKMGIVFQEFAYRFWQRHTRWEVKREVGLPWSLENIGGSALPPEMRMDVMLRTTAKTIVVECKFTNPLVEGRWFQNRNLKSTHLYQLNAYLTNLESSGSETDRCAEGILLYPQVEEKVHREYSIHGHRVRVVTVDLEADWREVHRQIMEVVEETSGEPRGTGDPSCLQTPREGIHTSEPLTP